MNNRSKKVFVGMSGGVDSSVAAALLKKDGYDVEGVFMRVWQPDFIECSRTDDKNEAMRVAAHLDIPFHVFDFEKEYKEEVVDYMISEYRLGRTPNPDVMCNKYVKFGVFLDKALSMGADYIATGHYARKDNDNNLLMGKDSNKDQTYFLWTLKKEQLKKTLFPVGEMEKSKVREFARKIKLPNAERKDSQGVCFIGEFDMKDFLSHYISKKKGDLLLENGEVIGYHDGAFFYTFGQRHGFTVTKKTPNDEPYYVIMKDVEKNTLTVSHRKEQEKKGDKEFIIKDVNFVSGEKLESEKSFHARIRYRQELKECKIIDNKNSEMKVIFKEPQSAVAKGQSLVIYDGEICLGGGVIK